MGIDGGLIGVIALDLVLTRIAMPVGWLRQVARAVAIGTVVMNGVAGWPEPVAVCLHAAAPVLLLAMVEAARSVLLRRMGRAVGTLRDSIPRARWLLSPWRTWLLWRHMVLWQITDYLAAIETELAVRHAVTLLRARYGRRWRRYAPVDVVWMLGNGIRVEEACGRVAQIAAEMVESSPGSAHTWMSVKPCR